MYMIERFNQTIFVKNNRSDTIIGWIRIRATTNEDIDLIVTLAVEFDYLLLGTIYYYLIKMNTFLL